VLYVFFWVIPRRLNFIRLRRWNRQSVPKRRHIKFRHRGITQKKAYNIQNTSQFRNQENIIEHKICVLIFSITFVCKISHSKNNRGRCYIDVLEQTECSEMSAYKIQTPGNYPEESIQHSEHVASLKSRKHY